MEKNWILIIIFITIIFDQTTTQMLKMQFAVWEFGIKEANIN